MRVKTFNAPTISQAMQMVRAELGEDAIILSTESERGRHPARLVAAVEDESLSDGSRAESDPLDFHFHDEARAESTGAEAASVEETIAQTLAFHRLPAPLAAHMCDVAREYAGEGPLLALSAAIDAAVGFKPLCERVQTRPILLVGPPGAGKTLSAAKLLFRAHRAGRPAAAVSADTCRAGGIEQLAAFTRILELPLTTASSPSSLAAEVVATGDSFVVIDTAGANLFDNGELDALAGLVTATNAEPVAVFAAGSDVLETAEMAERAAAIGCRRMLVTRIDISRRLGSVLTAAEAGGLALAEAGVGPQVADGLTPINPVSLARLLLPEAARTAPSCPGRTMP